MSYFAKIFLFFVLLVILFILGTRSYDSKTVKQINQKVVIQKPSVEKELNEILERKKKIEAWEKKNFPRVLRDAFNSKVDEKNQLEEPVLGGEIRLALTTEPPILHPYFDNSAVTSNILNYVYDRLIRLNSETFEKEPSLAHSWEVEDVLWLKGKRSEGQKSFFLEEDSENNRYWIGLIDESSIVYQDGVIQSLKIKVDGKWRVVEGKELRYKKSEDYTRAYDRGVVFTFYLREDVRWHDGKPFSADDVIFTLDLIQNPYIPQVSYLRNYYQSLKHWEKVDRYTVRLYWDTQYFKAIDFSGRFEILPQHVFVSEGTEYSQKELAQYLLEHPSNRNPVGTGPYYFPSELLPKREKLEAWIPKEKIELIRNDDYFDDRRKGNLRKIIFRFIPNPETSFIELKNGNLDYLVLTPEQFFESSLSPEFKAQFVKAYYYSGGFSYVGYNMKKVYFDDKRVRKAITLLLDRRKILKYRYYGLGMIVSGSQYYFGPAYDRSIEPYDYNRSQAVQLLNDAGWIDSDGDGIRDRNGVPMQMELLYPQGSQTAGYVHAFLSEELRGVGIELSLKQLEWAVFLEHLRDRKFDLCILGWGTPIESDPYQIWHSTQWSNQGSNHVGFQNEQADRIIETARRTLEDSKRHQLYFQFHEILHQEQPYLFLFTIPAKVVYHSRFRNVKFYRSGGSDLTEWFIPKELQTQQEREEEKLALTKQ